MNTKHTPGPWEARCIESQEWAIDAPNGDPTIGYSSWTALASVYGSNDFRREGEAVAEANARLIAAAPELLAACAGLLDALRTSGVSNGAIRFAEDQARAAIAKAEGRA